MMPIPFEQKIVAVLFSLILLLVTFQLIRKHKLREEYALIWLAASLAIFLLSIFDKITSLLAGLFAVKYAPTLILVFGILFCVVLLLAQTVMLSVQANRIRDLAQNVGLLEWRLRELESEQEPGAAEGVFTKNGHAPISEPEQQKIEL
jgi:hypothetical protein